MSVSAFPSAVRVRRGRCLPAVANLVALLVLGGCAGPGPPPHDGEPGVLARVDGHPISIREVETRLRSEGAGNADDTGASEGIDWPGLYREAAEASALEHLLSADLEAAEHEIEDTLALELGGEYPRLVCDHALELYLGQAPGLELPGAALRPSQEEIDTFHEEQREAFERPEQRLAWHLFLRYDEHGGEEATLARLEELRQRAEGGESFRGLARDYSDSENRQLGGHLGWVEPGKLPAALEEVVFSLPTSGTSEPLPTAGGAFLVHVSDVIPGVEVSEAEARRASVARLRELALLEHLESLAADVPRGEDWLLLGEEELREHLARRVPEQEVLRVGEVRLTAADFLELYEAHPARALELATPEERLVEIYRLQAARQLLCRQALDGSFFDDAKRRERLEAGIRRLGRARLLELRLEDRLRQRIADDPAAVERFYGDNRHLYQRPLRLLVRGLALEPEPSLEAAEAQLRELREALVAARLDLDGAVKELRGRGFETEALEARWLDPVALRALEPKVRAYLTQLSDTGYTVPFHQNGLLQLLHVEERQEPSPLPFAEARERVVQDYYQRHRQRLYQELASEVLDEAGFLFYEEMLRRHLDTLGLGS